MRFARNPALVKPGAGPEDNRQLFFSGGPPGVTRKDVMTLFSYYGKVGSWGTVPSLVHFVVGGVSAAKFGFRVSVMKGTGQRR